MNIKNIKTVSFQGIEGANSHLACKKIFPKAKVIPCETFEEVFESVKKNKANIALIPVENSVAGRVAEIHTLMHKTPLKIVGEYFLEQLISLQSRHDMISEVRGKGLLIAVEFADDISAKVIHNCNEAGLLLNPVKPNTVRFMPPLIIGKHEVDIALNRLESALMKV